MRSRLEAASFDLYAELGIDAGADRTMIRAAFRRAAKQTHPDVAATDTANERMVRLNLAVEVLLDPTRRAAYDRSRPIPRGTRRAREAAPERSRQPSRPGSGWGRSGCPVCRRPAGAALHHCALGHVAPRPIFGSPRAFSIRPEDHGSGADYPDAIAEARHARSCGWFGSLGPFGHEPYPAVPRIGRRSGATIDPEIYQVLREVASREAVDAAYEYAADGRVVLLVRDGDRLSGIVCGRNAYGATIRVDGTRGRCTCPSYRSPCKHPLALWLVHRLVPGAAHVS